MDLGLQDHVYVLTGATRGLGRASADALVSDGARVVVSGRSESAVAATVDALGPAHAAGVVADNASPDTAARLVQTAFDTFGRLDGALVSVGGPPPGAVTSITDEQWRTAFETIVLGGIRTATTVADALGEGGAIGFVLSTSVRQPIAGLAISNTMRPGLAMAAKTLADELGPRGIRVFGLLPGRVDTERVKELDGASDDPAATREAHRRTIPLRRYGRPDEFGAVAAFLLSPAAGYVTGVMLAVDGGITRSL